MSDDFSADIDWNRPWFESLRPIWQPGTEAADWRDALNGRARAIGLRNHRALPVRFSEQVELPRDTAYESFISTTGKVPTRGNLHDFFNALVWLAFPRTKARLNELQALAIEKASGHGAHTGARGRLRDAITLFDESAALFISCVPEQVQALRERCWTDVFVRNRADFSFVRCEVMLFGHALMEKLVRPYKAITAHALVVMVEPDFFLLSREERRRRIDAMLASRVDGELTPADFTPLPLAGVPGWWEGQDEAFYADTMVFRPPRHAVG